MTFCYLRRFGLGFTVPTENLQELQRLANDVSISTDRGDDVCRGKLEKPFGSFGVFPQDKSLLGEGSIQLKYPR